MRHPKSPHSDTLQQRLARYVDRTGGKKTCWLWRGYRNKWGYGRMFWKGRAWLAHRLAWVAAGNSIPSGLKVLHHCDTPACCNPAHLFLGTDADNAADKMRKGRLGDRRGEANGNARLTEKAVAKLRATPGTYADLGRRFGITATHAQKIIEGNMWKHTYRREA